MIASVTSDRTMQMSSAIPAMCGKAELISCPDWPCLAKSNSGPKTFNWLLP